MFKNKMKIFIVLIVFLLSMFASGCKDNEKNMNNVYFLPVDINSNYSIQKDCVLLHAKKDLVNYLDDSIFEEVLSNYNNSYFKNKSLIIFYNVETNSNNKSEITSYVIEKNMMTINVETKEFGNDFVMSYGYFILEVSKKEVNDVNSFKIIKNDDVVLNKGYSVKSNYIKTKYIEDDITILVNSNEELLDFLNTNIGQETSLVYDETYFLNKVLIIFSNIEGSKTV